MSDRNKHHVAWTGDPADTYAWVRDHGYTRAFWIAPVEPDGEPLLVRIGDTMTYDSATGEITVM